jgi:hypothetical protein
MDQYIIMPNIPIHETPCSESLLVCSRANVAPIVRAVNSSPRREKRSTPKKTMAMLATMASAATPRDILASRKKMLEISGEKRKDIPLAIVQPTTLSAEYTRVQTALS